jgi:hypothetical protein
MWFVLSGLFHRISQHYTLIDSFFCSCTFATVIILIDIPLEILIFTHHYGQIPASTSPPPSIYGFSPLSSSDIYRIEFEAFVD